MAQSGSQVEFVSVDAKIAANFRIVVIKKMILQVIGYRLCVIVRIDRVLLSRIPSTPVVR